jgi:hypothetical protein
MLWTVTAMGVFASVAVLAWALAAPLPMSADSVDAAPAEPFADTAATPSPAHELPRLEDFAVVWERAAPARTVAPRPEVEAASPAPTPSPPLQVQLLATAVERGRSYAVLLDQHSRVQVRREGEWVAGARVTAISAGRVEFEHHGRTVELILPREGGGP